MDETRNLPLVQDIILDMTESQLPVVYANQYDDSGRTVNCHMQDEGEDFDCSGYTIELWIKKSNDYALSETIVGENAIGSVSGNVVSFPIKENMTYSHGRQECRLIFLSSDGKTSSCNFYIRVNKAPEQNEDVVDSNEYKTFHNEYLELKTQIENIELGNISSESVKMADGTDLETKMQETLQEAKDYADTASPDNVVLYAEDGEITELLRTTEKWLKDKEDNMLIPGTFTTAVFNSEGKNVDELLESIDINSTEKIESLGLSVVDGLLCMTY